MKKLSDLPLATRQAIRGVFTDIDDTLTSDGRLTSAAYAAMEALQDKGLLVVPITGRPAGWCDQIARLWPVDGVVGENGAFYFYYDRQAKRMHRFFADDAETRKANRQRLMALGNDVVTQVNGAAFSSDQAYRETDLAIDFCEDVPPLPRASVDKIVDLLVSKGVTVKVSSIHVNGWFGNYDKLTMTKLYIEHCHGLDLESCETDFIFSGDSPNDAPMFKYFSHSVGVANVRDFDGQLDSPPAYITEGRGGAGFTEIADFLTSVRN